MIDPWEVIMIGAIVMALLLWGPQKIPELAKTLGEAKHELQTAGRGISTDSDSTLTKRD